MPRTIRCEQCGAKLNLPDQVPAGKKLKCPRCAHRFVVTEKDANSAPTAPADLDADNASTYEVPRSSLPNLDDPPVPRAEGDLREALDLPLLASDAEKSVGGGGSRRAAVSDAAALFQDDSRRRRKPTGAEARMRDRRCSRCGGVVAKGTSICPSCGTDQETGAMVGLDDDFSPPPPSRPTGAPLLITLPGMFCALAGGVLTILALVQSARIEEPVYRYGWIMLGVVAGYGVYGAVQFLRGKSVKVLTLALTLGAIVNVIALIGLPILEANFAETADVVVRNTSGYEGQEAAEMSAYEYKPLVDRLDQRRIKLGVGLLIGYAVFVAYLNSPPVKKFFIRRSLPPF